MSGSVQLTGQFDSFFSFGSSSYFNDVFTEFVDVPLEIVGKKPMNYPNPFKSNASTIIGYELNKAADVQIKFFNVFGVNISTLDINKHDEGGKFGYNRIPISATTFSGTYLSAGPYYYLIFNQENNSLLGKGSMVVRP